MSSLFESKVYQARHAMEWAEIDLEYFLKDLAQNDAQCRPARLEVHSRPSVRTRFWWTLTWTSADGEEQHAEGETMQLCLWRAAVREQQVRKRCEQREEEEEHPPECDCEPCGIARIELAAELDARLKLGE